MSSVEPMHQLLLHNQANSSFASQVKGGTLTEDEELAMAIKQSLQDPRMADAAPAAASASDGSGGIGGTPQPRTAPPQAPLPQGALYAQPCRVSIAGMTWTPQGSQIT